MHPWPKKSNESQNNLGESCNFIRWICKCPSPGVDYAFSLLVWQTTWHHVFHCPLLLLLRSFVSYMVRAQNMRRARALFRMEVIRKKTSSRSDAEMCRQTTKGSSWVTDWQKTYMAVVADALFSRFFPSFLFTARYNINTTNTCDVSRYK